MYICAAFNIWLACLQAPEGENQPSTDVDLFVSTEKIMVLNTDLQVFVSFLLLMLHRCFVDL